MAPKHWHAEHDLPDDAPERPHVDWERVRLVLEDLGCAVPERAHTWSLSSIAIAAGFVVLGSPPGAVPGLSKVADLDDSGLCD